MCDVNQRNWDLLRHGDSKQGLDRLRESYAAKGDASHIMELGIALLWLSEYEEAYSHFEEAIHCYPRSISSFYGMAGAAKWCVGDTDAAVKCWLSGLTAQYADGAGGVSIPLLLFAGSVIKPTCYDGAQAVEVLRAKTKDPRIKNWPGPLVQYILGNKSEGILSRIHSGYNSLDVAIRTWLTAFYEGVLELRVGNHEAFFQSMNRTVAAANESDERTFLACLWNVEYFLARCELKPNSHPSIM